MLGTRVCEKGWLFQSQVFPDEQRTQDSDFFHLLPVSTQSYFRIRPSKHLGVGRSNK